MRLAIVKRSAEVKTMYFSTDKRIPLYVYVYVSVVRVKMSHKILYSTSLLAGMIKFSMTSILSLPIEHYTGTVSNSMHIII